MDIWFTGDTHFSHANIIKYCNRPWQKPYDFDEEGNWVSHFRAQERANEMNEAIITNWNSVVKKGDTVYHLGDFAFGKFQSDFDKVFNRLNGQIIFIEGNHDSLASKHTGRFAGYHSSGLYTTKINGVQVVMCHYAMRVWDKSHYGAYHLYGHSHGSLPDDPNARSFDVGVDCHNFFPISWDTVVKIMDKKNFVPIDHHGRKEEGGIGLSAEDFAKLQRKNQYLALKKEFNE